MSRIALTDPRWFDLNGGYKVPEDYPALLTELAAQADPQPTQELWDALHH